MLELVQDILEIIEGKKVILKKPQKRKRYLKGKELEDYIRTELKQSIEENFSVANIEHLIRIKNAETSQSKHFQRFDYVIRENYRSMVKKKPEILNELLQPILKANEIKKYIAEDLEELYYEVIVKYLNEWEGNK